MLKVEKKVVRTHLLVDQTCFSPTHCSAAKKNNTFISFFAYLLEGMSVRPLINRWFVCPLVGPLINHNFIKISFKRTKSVCHRANLLRRVLKKWRYATKESISRSILPTVDLFVHSIFDLSAFKHAPGRIIGFLIPVFLRRNSSETRLNDRSHLFRMIK